MNFNAISRLRRFLRHLPKSKLDYVSNFQALQVFARNSSKDQSQSEEREIPKNVIGHIYSASSQPNNGRVYDYKPFKIRLYPKKQYHWCLCGLSKSQPMCDGTHRLPHMRCTLKPIKFEVEEEDDYYLCNCKQTKLRPFCDGTHKTL